MEHFPAGHVPLPEGNSLIPGLMALRWPSRLSNVYQEFVPIFYPIYLNIIMYILNILSVYHPFIYNYNIYNYNIYIYNYKIYIYIYILSIPYPCFWMFLMINYSNSPASKVRPFWGHTSCRRSEVVALEIPMTPPFLLVKSLLNGYVCW